jgi:hypothetical protein
MKTILLCLALVVPSVFTWAQDTVKPPADLKFTVRVDRTAVWPGDQFHYLIIVDHPLQYEFVLDNLNKETVNMEPLEVMDVQTNLVPHGSGRRMFVDLTLASFDTERDSIQVPQFTLFYFKKDSATTTVEQAAAESLTIPPSELGNRSTLPGNPRDIRDAVTVAAWERSRRLVPVLGWLTCAFLIVGSGREVVLFLKRRKSRKGPDRGKAMKAVRDRWTSRVPRDFTDETTSTDFLDRSYHDLKEYLGHFLETPSLGLTGEEMRQEMRRVGISSDLTQRVGDVIDTCETVRYTRNNVSDVSSAARKVADDMRAILDSTK